MAQAEAQQAIEANPPLPERFNDEQTLWEAVNTPLVELPRAPQQDNVPMQIVAGINNVAGATAEGLATPLGLATLPLLGAKTLGRVVAGGFGGKMLYDLPEQLRHAGEADTLQGKVEGYGGAILGALLGTAGVVHGVRGPKLRDVLPEPPPPPKTVSPAPATETAVTGTPFLEKEVRVPTEMERYGTQPATESGQVATTEPVASDILQPARGGGGTAETAAPSGVGAAVPEVILNEPAAARPTAAGETPAGSEVLGARNVETPFTPEPPNVSRPVDTAVGEAAPAADQVPEFVWRNAREDFRKQHSWATDEGKAAYDAGINQFIESESARYLDALVKQGLREPATVGARAKAEIQTPVAEPAPVQSEQWQFHKSDRQNESSTGGSVPATTGLKKATVDTERLSRGAEPIPPVERQREQGVVDAAAERAVAKPAEVSALVSRIVDDGNKAISEHDAATLLVERNRVMNERRAWEEQLGREDNTAATTAEASEKLMKIEEQLERLDVAQRAAGTTWGRLGHMYQRMIQADFSLEAMESKARAATGGPLNEVQRGQVQKLHAQVEKARNEIAAAEAKAEFERALESSRGEVGKPFDPPGFLEQQAARARQRILTRRERLYADPLGVQSIAHLADEAIIGAAHIAKGIKTFKAWSDTMLADFGKGIEPFLRALFAQSKKLHDDAAKPTPAEKYNRMRQGNIEKRMTELEKLQAEGKFKRDKKPVPDKTKETLDAEGRLLGAENEFKAWVYEQKLKMQPWYQKAPAAIQQMRGIILGSDIGILTRQGLFSWSRPAIAIKATSNAIKAALSPEAMDRWSVEQRDRVINGEAALPQRKAAGLQTTDTLSHPEELVITRWLSRLPDIKVGDRTVKLSAIGRTLERFQTTFINSARVDAFDWGIKHGRTPEELKLRANFINSATGRSNIKQVPKTLAAIMTSPRYEWSRWEMIGQPFRNVGALARDGMKGKLNRAALDNLQDMAVTGAEIYGVFKLAELAGYSVNWNPSSTDFLKMRKGEEVWDVTAGIAPRMRDLMRLYVGFTHPQYSTTLGKTMTGMGLRTINPALKTSVEQTSIVVQKAQGIDEPKLPFTGFQVGDEQVGLITLAPLIVQSINKALEDGPGAAAFTGAREFIGSGVSRYPESETEWGAEGSGSGKSRLRPSFRP